MPETKPPSPPLVETAVPRGCLPLALWLAFGVAVLFVVALGMMGLVNAPAEARARAFAAAFVESAVKGTDLHRRSLAPPARADEVEQARAWMTPDFRVVRCKATRLAFSIHPPRRHECVVRFSNGGFVDLDVADQDGEIRVDTFVSSAPRGSTAR